MLGFAYAHIFMRKMSTFKAVLGTPGVISMMRVLESAEPQNH